MTDKYPDLSKSDRISFDIETYDPNLLKLGAGVYRCDGYILGVAIATSTFSAYYNLGHYDCTEELRNKNVAYIRKVLALPCEKVGTNVMYDTDWLENWVEFHATDFRRRSLNAQVKGKLLDIQVAEPILDEYARSYSLDTLANKYLGRGKAKNEIDQFCKDNKLSGDSRKHLYRMPSILVEKYAIADVTLPLQIIAQQLKLIEEQGLTEIFELETALLRPVMNMRRTGALIDTVARDNNIRTANNQLFEAKQRIKNTYGDINYNSSQQIAKLLDKANIDYERKLVFTTKEGLRHDQKVTNAQGVLALKFKMSPKLLNKVELVELTRITCGYPKEIHSCNPSIPKEFLETLEEQLGEKTDASQRRYQQVVEDILFCRKADKTINTFLAGSLKETVCMDGRIHPTINTLKGGDAKGLFGTVTGRFSMSNPNLQQIPSQGKNKVWGNMCRECFIAGKDQWFAKLDYSQIEYRILAHYALGDGAQHLRDTYNNDPNTDYHQYIQDMTGLERSYAKTLNFGVMYGMGLYKMMLTFGWSREFCEELLAVYHGNAPYIKATMNRVGEVAEVRGYIKTIGGRHAHSESKDKSYKMLNKLIQGSAADVMKKAIIDVDASGIFKTIACPLTVHDELDLYVDKTADSVRKMFRVKHIMQDVYPMKVPIKVDIEIGSNWSNVGELDFDKLIMSKNEHTRLLPHFKNDMSKDFTYYVTEEVFLKFLTDANVVQKVESYVALFADIKQAKKKEK